MPPRLKNITNTQQVPSGTSYHYPRMTAATLENQQQNPGTHLIKPRAVRKHIVSSMTPPPFYKPVDVDAMLTQAAWTHKWTTTISK